MEINVYLITKMGWLAYSKFRGIGIPNSFDDDDMVRYFINNKSDKMCYLIKELTQKQKQKLKKSYKFIIMDYNFEPKFEIINFEKNDELLSLIIEHEACDSNYQRHFRINKILKTK
jgi:hypothetical protein